MRLIPALLGAAALSMTTVPYVQAAPQMGASALAENGSASLLEDVRLVVRYYRGYRYCFYFDGWHGPGWYRCGWAWRDGYGWGGAYGWNDWYYGPAVIRFGHRGTRYGERHHHQYQTSPRVGTFGARSRGLGPNLGTRAGPAGSVHGPSGAAPSFGGGGAGGSGGGGGHGHGGGHVK